MENFLISLNGFRLYSQNVVSTTKTAQKMFLKNISLKWKFIYSLIWNKPSITFLAYFRILFPVIKWYVHICDDYIVNLNDTTTSFMRKA